LEEDGEKFLIDCGSQTPNALAAAGVKAKDIGSVYISHLHADHIGGLEWLAFTRYDWINHPRKYNDPRKSCAYAPHLYGDKQLIKDLWDKSLRGGLESMEGFVATLDTFFEPHAIEPNESFTWQGWNVRLVQQIHILSGSIITPSFGIIFTKPGHKTVYFVTDSQHVSPRQMEVFYQEADLIFQDCECTGVNFLYEEGAHVYTDDTDEKKPVFPWPTDDMKIMELLARGNEGWKWKRSLMYSGVHANYAQLAGYESANSVKLPADIKKKMWLSHYQDFVGKNLDMYGNSVSWENQVDKDGFAGFVIPKQVFEI
jgi:hypothetical protein